MIQPAFSSGGYPPSPWRLRGRAVCGFAFPPLSAIPRGDLDGVAPGHLPVVVGGRALVLLAAVDYTRGSVTYREVVTALVTRRGVRPRISVLAIWVTTREARDGGRRLWGIPKSLGVMDRSAGTPPCIVLADVAGREIVRAHLRRRGPTWLPLAGAFTTAQRADGCTVETLNRAAVAAGACRADWAVAPDGPLGYLDGWIRPGGVAMRFRLAFGVRCRRTPTPGVDGSDAERSAAG